jgi:hypothetical protein
MKRRTLLSMTAAIVVATAGCGGNGGDTDDGDGRGNGEDTGSSGEVNGDDADGECEQEVLVDATEVVPAGDSLTYALELNEGWTLDLIVEQAGDGAQPTVDLTDPEGSVLLEAGPSELIYELVDIESSGEHTLSIRNEDADESGEFDIRVDHVSPAC